MCRGSLTTLDELAQGSTQAIAASDHVDPYGLLETTLCLGQQVASQQGEQSIHLGARPIPVRSRECVQCQCADLLARCRGDDGVNSLRARPMARGARQMT